MNPRCRHCWRGLGAFIAIYFAYFETRAFKSACHRTLSRELRELGPCAVFAPAVAGLWLTHHLLRLQDLIDADHRAGTTLEESHV